MMAIQGPRLAAVLDGVGLPSSLKYMAFTDAMWPSDSGPVEVTVCRTGYTGEHGYEVLVESASADAVWVH